MSDRNQRLDHRLPRKQPAASAFPWYLTSSSLWLGGMSLQGFLITWLLVGVLNTPADEVGAGRALIEVPGLLILILGGLIADRMDGRTLLLRMHLLIAVPALLIAGIVYMNLLHYWWVIAFGTTIAAMQSVTDPARQAMLSRIARLDIQRTVTITTIVTSVVGIAGVWIGGQLEMIGLSTVLVVQSLLFVLGALAVVKLPKLPPTTDAGTPALGNNKQHSNLTIILSGFKAVWALPLVRNLIGLNFLSSLFNAGAYVIAVPFIATQVYGGNAEFYASVVMMFTAGAVGSNILLLYFMPLSYPGRLFLFMQLTRVAILVLLWMQPPLWLFYGCMVAWGLNMGITSTLVRATVQELAPEAKRARILSLLLLSFMLSAPISSLLLGTLVAGLDPLDALLPGIGISLIIFVLGVWFSGLWHYRSSPFIADIAD